MGIRAISSGSSPEGQTEDGCDESWLMLWRQRRSAGVTSGVQPGGCAEVELEDGEFAAAHDRARAKLMHCELEISVDSD